MRRGTPKIDARDAEILVALQQRGRITNKELADSVGIAASTCVERVRRLTEQGVIVGYRAEVSLRAMGVGMEAIVSVRLARATEEAVAAFRRNAADLEAVVMILGLAGDVDFLLHLAVDDTAQLQKTLNQLAACQEGAHLNTSVLMDVERFPFPHYPARRSQ